MINRAPVLTFWAAVVAEILGFEHDETLTLGRAVAGLNAYSEGLALEVFQTTIAFLRRNKKFQTIAFVETTGDLNGLPSAVEGISPF